jgi:hypothetical protein
MRALVEHELLLGCKAFATILTRELRWIDAAVRSVYVEGKVPFAGNQLAALCTPKKNKYLKGTVQ